MSGSNGTGKQHENSPVWDRIDPYHSAAVPEGHVEFRGIKSFVFARQASARRKFSVRLAVQSFMFYSPKTQHGRRVIRVYCNLDNKVLPFQVEYTKCLKF